MVHQKKLGPPSGAVKKKVVNNDLDRVVVGDYTRDLMYCIVFWLQCNT